MLGDIFSEDRNAERPTFRSPTMPAVRVLDQFTSDPASSLSSLSESTPLIHKPPLPKEKQRRESTSKKRHPSVPRAYAQFLSQNSLGLKEAHDPSDPSLANSHPRAHRSHTRSKSPDSISALLILTTERLSQETARANAAEKNCAELMTHVKSMHETRSRLDQDLSKVREELGLYKLQLDLAQKEIFRAQDIVEKVEKQRVEAEERAMKDRERARKLLEQRAVHVALDEGRRLGYKEGLERGRMMAWSEVRDEQDREREERERERQRANRERHRTQTLERERARERNRLQQEENRSPPSSPQSSASASTHSGTPVRNTPPGIARYAPTLPVPTVVTPVDVRVPSTQPQPFTSQHQHNGIVGHSPSDIDVQHGSTINLDYGESRPTSVRNLSPSVSHRSIVLPPDGFIPTLGPDSLISLPPPHELSLPVPPSSEYEPQQENGERTGPRVRDYAYGGVRGHSEVQRDQDDARSTNDVTPYPGRPGTASTTSRVSTRISQYDLVSPPGEPDTERQKTRNRAQSDASSPTPYQGRSRTRALTQPERIVEEWRSANSDILSSGTPPPPASLRRVTEAGGSNYASSIGSIPMGNLIERPSTTQPTTTRPRVPRASGVHRPPREVVLPMPLTSVLLDGGVLPRQAHDTLPLQPPPESSLEQQRMLPSEPGQLFGNWARDRFVRTVSNESAVPQIDIEPPSHSPSNHSETTIVDPVLLTPDHHDSQVPLPQALSSDSQQDYTTTSQNATENIRIVLPDNHLPPGFVPFNSIPALSNDIHVYSVHTQPQYFNPSRPEFQAPTSPRPSYATAPIPEGVTYPDPPLVQPSTVNETTSQRRPDLRRRVTSFGASAFSPAVNRPLSIFSDSET